MRDRAIKILNKQITGIIMSVVIGFFVGAIVLAVAGYNPLEAYGYMFQGMFSKPKYVAQILINATPIMLTGVSVAFAFQTGLFNIGVEGQYIVGALTAAVIGNYLPMPKAIHPVVIFIVAFIVGGIFGGIAGVLKSKFGIHEVISTIMLNWIALYLNNFVINLPGVKDEGTQSTHQIMASARIRILAEWKKTDAGKAFIKNDGFFGDILRTDIHGGIIVAIIIVIIIWYFLNHTTKGYELRAVGSGKDAAEFAGIGVNNNINLSMFISGGLAAVAGALHIMGTNSFRVSVLSAQEGYGWDGISVALLAGNNPLGTLISSFLYSGLKYGGGSIQSKIGAPSEVIDIMVGVIVYSIAISTVFPLIADFLKKRSGGRKNG